MQPCNKIRLPLSKIQKAAAHLEHREREISSFLDRHRYDKSVQERISWGQDLSHSNPEWDKLVEEQQDALLLYGLYWAEGDICRAAIHIAAKDNDFCRALKALVRNEKLEWQGVRSLKGLLWKSIVEEAAI